MRILFCNIGWMEYYRGVLGGDEISNGGSFNDERDGVEQYNFLNLNGKYYGYVSQNNLSIHRIEGISKKVDRANNVLVVWVARHKTLGTVIVGWYKNATVHKQWQVTNRVRNVYEELFYNIETEIKDGYLLPVEERKFKIPRRNNKIDDICMGQANVWYADEERHKKFVEKVIEYIDNYDGKFIEFPYESDLDEKIYIEVDKNKNLEEVLDEENYFLAKLQIINGFIEKNKYEKKDLIDFKVYYLLELGFINKALETIEKNSDIKELEVFFKFQKAYIYGTFGKIKKALEFIDQYLEYEKDDQEAIEYKSLILQLNE